MNSSNLTTGRPPLRRRVLLGTVSALALGAAVVAGTVLPNISANAQPVVIAQPVTLPSFADVVDAVAPAVVGIRVRGESTQQISIPGLDNLPPGVPEQFFRGLPEQETVPTTSIGSGFFVSEDGYIVTNNHVVDHNATDYTVILNDGTELTATLIGTDELTDLALLKVDADHPFAYVEFATGEVRVGDWAIAVGTPFGLGNTVTAGIVSAKGRQIGSSAYDDYIQIDAAVNQGNSGGPTFNLAGQVIGVNTAIYSPTGGNVGIAFDIPATVAADVIADLKDDGVVSRGYLGIQIQSVDATMAGALGLPGPGGALVGGPNGDSPAFAAGIQTRDVILKLNGEDVADSTDLARKIGALDPGVAVTLTVFRNGQTMDITVTLTAMPTDAERDAANTAPTPSPGEPAPEANIGLAIGNYQGQVVIADINPTGSAAQAGLKQGDVIVAIGDTQVQSTQDVRDAVQAARDGDRPAVLFQVTRDGATLFFAVPL
jgi:serine protease Do